MDEKILELLDGRKLAFKSMFGSHNYNLNDETSDVDYKYFIYPNFDDLYYRRFFSVPSQTSEEMDFDSHDIRKFPEMLYKANINFLEVLFSNDTTFYNKRGNKASKNLPDGYIEELFYRRDEIAKMNIPYLYHACKGMYFNKMSALHKGTKGTRHLVKQFGYDTKQAMCAYRVLDFCNRFYERDFDDFTGAMSYSGEERDFLIGMKRGAMTEEEFRKALAPVMKKFLTLEDKFASMKEDNVLMDEIKLLIKHSVELHIIG